MRGGQFYDDPELLEAYLAHRHTAVASPNLVMENPAFLSEARSLADLRILDLGCGDGTFAAACVEAGCERYVGVDGSTGMIERATASVQSPTVSFEVADLEEFQPDQAAFDLVVARMALHYLADLQPVLDRSRAALADGGRLIFTVIHPVITAPTEVADGPRQATLVDRYFEPGERRREWFGKPVVWHHRTIGEYVRAIRQAGLHLDNLTECEPVEDLFNGDTAELARRRRVPLFLLISASA